VFPKFQLCGSIKTLTYQTDLAKNDRKNKILVKNLIFRFLPKLFFLAMTGQPQTLDDQSRALKMQIYA